MDSFKNVAWSEGKFILATEGGVEWGLRVRVAGREGWGWGAARIHGT